MAERHLPRAPSMATVPTVAMLMMALGATTHQRHPCLHPHQQEALHNNAPLLLLMMLMLLLHVLQLKVLRAPQAAATSPPPGQRQPRGARSLTHEHTRSSARFGL